MESFIVQFDILVETFNREDFIENFFNSLLGKPVVGIRLNFDQIWKLQLSSGTIWYGLLPSMRTILSSVLNNSQFSAIMQFTSV